MKRILLSITALALILTFALTATSHQIEAQDDDDMMLHVCDSTLITLLFIAEYDYGFHSMLDISTFDKGQYQPLFDAMMMMDDDMMGDDMEDDAEMMDEDMDEDMGDDMMMEGMTMLTPGHIADEDPACTELRNELDAFFYEELSHAMMMMDDEMMEDEG
ncbi:MAG: hypothetical protein CUN56_08350 [Phototrophicales bacterium]|nr:MAG: hypothetical protein CUN56_08350 [Phototrophicales bacterium]RMG70544.1 MAG: hypothetical protein D6711_17060 [Chloroflexota bacterium]